MGTLALFSVSPTCKQEHYYTNWGCSLSPNNNVDALQINLHYNLAVLNGCVLK